MILVRPAFRTASLVVLFASAAVTQAGAATAAPAPATASVAGLEEHWEYYANGVQRVHGWLDGQRREGRWTFWSESGQIERILDYRAGIVVGTAAGTEAAAVGSTSTVEPAAVSASVALGLDWLVKNQLPDGRWSVTKSAQKCPPAFNTKDRTTEEYDVGLTGLATRALIRAQDASAKSGIAVDGLDAAAKKAVAWLVAAQKPDGSIHEARPFMYNQAIAARALVAAYASTRDDRVRAAAQRAVEFLQRAQRPSSKGGLGGWRYASRQEVEKGRPSPKDASEAERQMMLRELYDADTSITAWCVSALRAARDAGLTVDQEALDGASSFIAWLSVPNGQVGYIDPKGAGATVTGKNDHFVYHPAAMSALGMLVRLDTGAKQDDGMVQMAAQRVLADQPRVTPDKLSIDYYYWHHGLSALKRSAAPGADAWANQAVASLIDLQSKGETECSRGAWVTQDRWSYSGGALYTTALNTLTLEDQLGWD